MGGFRDISGQRFGRLVVLEVADKNGKQKGHKFWVCVCDCGKVKKVKSSHLIQGYTKSCGCWRADNCGIRFTKHALRGTKEFALWKSARDRAKVRNIEFKIAPSDIYIPSLCPLLGISIDKAKKGPGAAPNSPSLDRIDPSKGYVKGNIWVISHRANTMKSNGTLEELLLLVQNWEKKLNQLKQGLEEAA